MIDFCGVASCKYQRLLKIEKRFRETLQAKLDFKYESEGDISRRYEIEKTYAVESVRQEMVEMAETYENLIAKMKKNPKIYAGGR